jgi:hypothetical protein
MNARVMNANAVVINAMKHPQNMIWDGFWSVSFMGWALSGKEEGEIGWRWDTKLASIFA